MRALFASCLLLCACHSVGPEARALVTAVDRYRHASNDDKPAIADELEKLPCGDEKVCAAKAACAKSATTTAKGLRLQKEVRDGIERTADGGTVDSPRDLADKFAEAGRKLDEGFAALEDCNGRIERLRAEYAK